MAQIACLVIDTANMQKERIRFIKCRWPKSILLISIAAALLSVFSKTTIAQTAVTLDQANADRPERAVRERVTQLAAANTTDPLTALKSGRYVYVHSKSLLVGSAVVEEKLRKRKEFQQLGMVITRNWEEADLVLELRHDLFTMYVYTAIDPRSKVVVASGKLSSLGGTVAGKVAKRFMKQVMKARGM